MTEGYEVEKRSNDFWRKFFDLKGIPNMMPNWKCTNCETVNTAHDNDTRACAEDLVGDILVCGNCSCSFVIEFLTLDVTTWLVKAE